MAREGKLAKTLSLWFKSSSIDGIGHAGRARNYVTRSMWIMVFMAGISITVFHLYWILQEYGENEVRTTILLSPESEVTFPSLTVCNVNRIHCSNLKRVLREAICSYEYIVYEYPIIYDDYEIFNVNCSDFPPRYIVEDSMEAWFIIDTLASIYSLTFCYLPDGYILDAYDTVVNNKMYSNSRTQIINNSLLLSV